MRPLRLELEGFTAFSERACLDFAELDLFAIMGPTGAGKSSLIDAIAYALYGEVPRVGKGVGSCISQGRDRLHVQLELEAGGRAYRVFRETRRQGAPSVRLEWLDGDQWEPLMSGAQKVTERVARVIGLDFDGFTRSVLLPQGKFAEFLAGSLEKRRDVLRGLLRLEVYEQVRQRASNRAARLAGQITGLQTSLDALKDATSENQQLTRDDLMQAQSQAKGLETERAALQDAADLGRELALRRADYDRAHHELQRAQLDLAEAVRAVAEGDSRTRDAEARLKGVRERMEANAYDSTRHTALVAAAQLAEQAERVVQRLRQAAEEQERLEKRLEEARSQAQQAAEADEQAQRDADRAAEELRHAERHNAAATVQEGLQPGNTCPVCGAVVGELPTIECPDLDRARTAAKGARDDRHQAQQALVAAGEQVASAQARVGAGQEGLACLTDDANGLRARLADALPAGVEATRESITAQLDIQRKALAERERLQDEQHKAQDALRELQQELAAAKQKRERLQATAEAKRGDMETAQSEGENAREKLATLVSQRAWADIEVGSAEVATQVQRKLDDAKDRLGDVQQRIGQLTKQVEQLQEQIEKRKEHERELGEVKQKYAVAWELAQLLRADRFQAFVQSEALRLLAEVGSARLEQLSDKRYRLAVADNSQDFEVLDVWHAEERRSVRTLSGGETFLASLALSLALAESLPGLAVGGEVLLDAMFIDEGFGSLDPEALDRAADALDSLRTAGRMVCVVTHLKELAERLPARVEVHASESGSTLEVIYT